jgi:alkylhydroperoxidase/carboxymuconolactone decarboxylase family protein YurZ
VAALANMHGTEGQLRFHLGAALNIGLTETQLKDFVAVLQKQVGKQQAESASKLLSEVLHARDK